MSQRHEPNASQCTPSVCPTGDASVHQAPQGGGQHVAIPVHQRLGHNHDARSTIDARRRTYGDPREGARRGYHPQRGRRYDSSEDRSPSPSLPGPQAFGRHILNAAFPQGTDHLPISLSTLGRQTLDFGSKTIGLSVKSVGQIMTTSLSAISHCSWPI